VMHYRDKNRSKTKQRMVDKISRAYNVANITVGVKLKI